MKSQIKEAGRRVLEPVARGLIALRLTPDQITIAGLVLSFGAAALAARGDFGPATVLLLVGALCDVLDGSMARLSGRSSTFGAFLDSTIDRYAELALFLGYAVFFAVERDPALVGVSMAAAAGSMLVSYTRARAEGLGLECKVGLMERPERLVVLIVATGGGPLFLRPALWGLAVLTHFTALQRVWHVRGLLRRKTS